MRQRSGLPNVPFCSNKQSFPLSVRDRDRDGACTSTAALPYLCAVSGNSGLTTFADGRSNCHCRANQATSSARKAIGQCDVLVQDDCEPDSHRLCRPACSLHWLPYMEQKATRRVQEASRKAGRLLRRLAHADKKLAGVGIALLLAAALGVSAPLLGVSIPLTSPLLRLTALVLGVVILLVAVVRGRPPRLGALSGHDPPPIFVVRTTQLTRCVRHWWGRTALGHERLRWLAWVVRQISAC